MRTMKWGASDWETPRSRNQASGGSSGEGRSSLTTRKGVGGDAGEVADGEGDGALLLDLAGGADDAGAGAAENEGAGEAPGEEAGDLPVLGAVVGGGEDDGQRRGGVGAEVGGDGVGALGERVNEVRSLR